MHQQHGPLAIGKFERFALGGETWGVWGRDIARLWLGHTASSPYFFGFALVRLPGASRGGRFIQFVARRAGGPDFVTFGPHPVSSGVT